MLTHIKKIKSFGVFEDYAAAANFPAFSRYNVIYGENGSGKTTLSRLLACLEAGEHAEYPNLEFTLETESGQLNRGTKYGRRVRVFNSDFVEANIGRFDGPLKHILILGEENKAIAEALQSEIITRDERLKGIQANSVAATKLENDRGKLFSAIAKIIGEATSGSTLRSYRKPDAEAAYAKIDKSKTLSDDEYELHRSTVRQEQMLDISALTVPRAPENLGDFPMSVLQAAAGMAGRATVLTRRTAQSSVIARLSENPDIARWAETGVGIHAKHASGQCEFCAQPMPPKRLQMLAEHFSIEDQALKADIETERDTINIIIESLGKIILPDRLAFYSELRDKFDAALEVFELEREELKRQLNG